MKMKQILIAGLVASTFLVAGCGDEPKTEQELQLQHQKEILAMKLAHDRSMMDKEIQLAKTQNGVVGESSPAPVYRESPSYTEEPMESVEYSAPMTTQHRRASAPSYDPSYEQPMPQPTASVGAQVPASQPAQQVQGDEGFGVGSMALAALGGAAAGYFAGEMLNNGMKSYKDERGNVHYTDKDGRPVSKASYEEYKKKNPKTQAFREKARDVKSGFGQKATSVKNTVVQKASDVKQSVGQKATSVNNSQSMNSFRERAQANKAKMQQTQSYQKTKSSVNRAATSSRSNSRKRR